MAAGVTEVGMYSGIWSLSVRSASEGAGETLPVPGNTLACCPWPPARLE